MLKITLRVARESCGYTVEEVSEYCLVPVAIYHVYEKDPGVIPKNIACKIKKLFGIMLEAIDINSDVANEITLH